MKKFGVVNAFPVLFMAIVIVMPFNLIAGTNDTQAQSGKDLKFKQEVLDQILAPIALYPDSLLAQVLMASTYPLEVVEAARWLKDNSNLKDSDLDNAIKDKDWEVSVKSLVHFPQVLQMMSDKIEWTEKVGDAFLAQKDDVMNTVQNLRAKSKDAGNLKTTTEQKVVVADKIIEILPANPEVVYVPMYDPAVVYGPWWYPAYPPYPVYYPGWTPAGVAAVSFASGFFVGAAVSSWAGCNWYAHDVNVNVNRTASFNNVNVNKNVNVQNWQHDAGHRQGVPYKSASLNQRYGSISAVRSSQNVSEPRHEISEHPRASREEMPRNFQPRSGEFHGGGGRRR